MPADDSHTEDDFQLWKHKRETLDHSSSYLGAGVFGIMIISVVAGGLFGGAIALLLAPAFAPALMIGCALSFAASGVFYVLRKTAERHSAPDEYGAGNSRTEDEVRAALADIKAPKK